MSEDPRRDSTLRLMGTTPMRDWARGRLTGRLDRDRLLLEAGLPAALADLIRLVVQRTRLWRSEKVDVTRELIAHFRDGLAAGADPAALAVDFGDPARAARLIRRAKRRNRPLPWRAMIYTRNALAGLVLLALLLYAGLAVRYFNGRATISRDYLAELNHPIQSIPESERAWPLYREGIFLLPVNPPDADLIAGQLEALDPQDPRREPYIAYLRACAPALEKFAQAAARPRLGAVISVVQDVELTAQWQRLQSRAPAPASAAAGPAATGPAVTDSTDLVGVIIPYLGKFRSIARTVAADAQLAAIDQDSARLDRDLRTLIGIAAHVNDHPFLIGQLTGIALVAQASEQVMFHVDRNAALLTDAQLRDLAHRLASISDGNLRIRLAGEITFFDDTMQRLYTDDGNGDGRIAGGAVKRARSLLSPEWPYGDGRFTIDDAVGPVVMGVTAGRAEITRLYRSYIAQAQAYSDVPMWERGEPEVTAALEALANNPVSKARYWPALMMIPALDRLPAATDVTTQRRDAALTAIALELHRRRAGSYPESLDALAPGLLPKLPPDQFDGRPIRYLLRDGRPVLYSIGTDRKDDGGRRPVAESTAEFSWVSPERARRMLDDQVRRPRIDGDWILFPPARGVVPPPDPGAGAGPAP